MLRIKCCFIKTSFAENARQRRKMVNCCARIRCARNNMGRTTPRRPNGESGAYAYNNNSIQSGRKKCNREKQFTLP